MSNSIMSNSIMSKSNVFNSVQANSIQSTAADTPTDCEQPGPQILIVEDDEALREALCDTLELAGFQTLNVASGEQALQLLQRQHQIAMVISDVNMGGMSGYDLLQQVRSRFAHVPMLLITAYGSVSQSVAAMQNGAVDYLVKPFAHDLLIDAVNRHAKHQLTPADQQPVAVADSSRRLLQLARRAANSDSTLLIVGESGSGKEVLARYVHQQSPRANQVFVAVNCAAIPENMLESILFGHEKGAYTGAYSSAPGKFEQANGGTLLLDEISEIDLGLQAKLLRVLQEREVERLGGRKTITLDVRVIATSNRNLIEEVQLGRFREDLYYRLNILPLQWAPLRERVEDILPLATRLLNSHAQKQQRSGIWLDQSAKLALQRYQWPGNVRELDNIMQRALILQTGNTIGAEDLGLAITDDATGEQGKPLVFSNEFRTSESDHGVAGSNHSPVISSLTATLSEQTTVRYGGSIISTEGFSNSPDSGEGPLDQDLKQREFEIILAALRQEHGSRKNTARRLGLSPRTLRYKIARLRDQGLDVADALARLPY